MLMRRWLASTLLALSTFACGGATLTTSDTNGDAGSADVKATDDSNDVKVTDDSNDAASPSCADPLRGDVPYGGSIELSNSANGTVHYSVVGAFWPLSDAAPDVAACAGTAVGSCCYTRFKLPGLAIGIAPAQGPLTVSDGSKILVTIDWQWGYQQSSQIAPGLAWLPGDLLGVAVHGGGVDGFRGSVVAPPPLADLAPAFGSSIDVSLSSDLNVTWTKDGDPCSRTVFSLDDGDVAGIICTVDDSAGGVTVPASLLALYTSATGFARIERKRRSLVHTPTTEAELDAVNLAVTTVNYVR
jgi:hypothetical protein